MRVKIGPQFKQRLQTNLHKNVSSTPAKQAPDHLNKDERETKNQNQCCRIVTPPGFVKRKMNILSEGKTGDDIVNDDLKGPWLEQI
jgi:hypothetical protein